MLREVAKCASPMAWTLAKKLATGAAQFLVAAPGPSQTPKYSAVSDIASADAAGPAWGRSIPAVTFEAITSTT